MTVTDTKQRLKEKGFRATEPRIRMLRALSRTSCCPQTVEELRKYVGGIDRVTAYRILEAFADAGLSVRLEFGEGKCRYEQAGHHHHHVVCTKCGAISEVEDCLGKTTIRRLEQKTGFTVLSHRLEFFGLCPSCRNRA